MLTLVANSRGTELEGREVGTARHGNPRSVCPGCDWQEVDCDGCDGRTTACRYMAVTAFMVLPVAVLASLDFFLHFMETPRAADFYQPAFQVLHEASFIEVADRVFAQDFGDFLCESFNDDSLSPFVFSAPHLLQVKHDVHINRLLFPCEPKPALEIQFWIAAHQDDYKAEQATTVVLRGKVPSRGARHLTNDLAHSRLRISVACYP
jgi:hypothetical protein